MNRWTKEDIPDQAGKQVLITGGNTGLGYEIGKQLANKNAEIHIACRDMEKGNLAVKRMESELGKDISAKVLELDLTDRKSISGCAESYASNKDGLDLLINNAGVVNLKEYSVTKEGTEMHLATNHFGHFALTGLLLPLLLKRPNARVVTMSSGAHKFGSLDFDDLNWEKRPYDRSRCYGDSKLANLLFALQLQRRFESKGHSVLSLAAHPGLSATERQQRIGIGGWLSKILAQPVWKGALPALFAASSPEAKAGAYYGPRYEIWGYPKLSKMDPKAHDLEVANQLWEFSERVTGVSYGEL